MGYIYITTNLINGKQYIGKRVGKFTEYYKGSGKLLKVALEKYGKDVFKVEILEDNIQDKKELSEKERLYISKYNAANSPNYYNITAGGDGGMNFPNGYLGSSQHKIDASYNMKRNWENPKYRELKLSQLQGRQFTTEQIENLRKAHLHQNNENLRIPVVQYNLDMIVIQEFESCSEAARFFKKKPGATSSISVACKTGSIAWGFFWRYKDKSKNLVKCAVPQDTSKYRGVTYNNKTGKYTASINFQKKKLYLGSFNTPEEAYKAYCAQAKDFYGESAKLYPYKMKPKTTKK